MKRKRYAWFALFLVTITAGVVFSFAIPTVFGDDNQEQAANDSDIQSSVARSGDLRISVTGSGEMVPLYEAELGFQATGELVELNVKVGDQVLEGDILARMQIDQTTTELTANQAAAKLEVLSAQQKLDHLYHNAQISSAQALLAVEEAQQAFENLEHDDLEIAIAQQDLSQAQEAVEQSEMNLYITNSSPSQQAMDTAYASLLFKEKQLKELQDQLAQVENQFKSSPDAVARERLDQQIKSLRVQIANQQLEYENALYRHNALDDPPEAIELAVAEAQLATAQAQLAVAQQNWEQVQGGPQASDLGIAEAQLAEALAEWERLKNGPDPGEIALLEAQLAKAEAKLESINSGQLILDLIAPMDGIVLSISAEVGDSVGGETILTLADVSQKMVLVSLDEIDSANIQVGDQAEVSFDVNPEKTFGGQVVQVNPSLVGIGNSQAANIWVLLDGLPNEFIALPLGVNLTVDIVTGDAQNAVLVTNEALYKDANGGDRVYVVEGDSLSPRPVQVGLRDATTAEIIAGLLPGEHVAIGNLNFDQE